MTYRLEIAKQHIGSFRRLLISDRLDVLDPDGATGVLATLESIRERVAEEAGCDMDAAGTIEGCGDAIAVDDGHWHDGRCYCDGCEDAPADAADPDSRVYDRPEGQGGNR